MSANEQARASSKRKLVELSEEALDRAMGGAAAGPVGPIAGKAAPTRGVETGNAAHLDEAVGAVMLDHAGGGGANFASATSTSGDHAAHGQAVNPIMATNPDVHGPAVNPIMATNPDAHGPTPTGAPKAEPPAGPTLEEKVDGVLGRNVTSWDSGSSIGHVNAGMEGGQSSGTHTGIETGTSVTAGVDKTGIKVEAHEDASAQAGATYNQGPMSAQVNAHADAHATESIHLGSNGIDVTLKAGVEVGASEGVSVSGNLGHGVTGSVGVENTTQAELNAGLKFSNTQVEAAARAGVNDTLEVGGGIQAGVGGGVNIGAEVHTGVKVYAEGSGHAAFGTGSIAAEGGMGVGAVETVGAGLTVGDSHFNGHAGGSLDSPGAIGANAGASARFHDGTLSLDLNGKIDLGFAGVGFNLGVNLDMSVPEHAIADGAKFLAGAVTNEAGAVGHAIAGGATDAANTVAHGVTDAAHAVAHGVTDTAHTVAHGVTGVAHTVGHGFVGAAHTVGHGLQKAGHAVGKFFSSW